MSFHIVTLILAYLSWLSHCLLLVFTFWKLRVTNAFCFQVSSKSINSWALKWHWATSLFVWINVCVWYVYNCSNTPFLPPDSSVEIQFITLWNSKHVQHCLLKHCYFKMFTIWSVESTATNTMYVLPWILQLNERET